MKKRSTNSKMMTLTSMFMFFSQVGAAQQLDMSRARNVAEFYFANHSFDLVTSNGFLIFPDSQSKSIMVRELRGTGPNRDFTSPLNRPTYITPVNDSIFAISDAYANKVALIDVASRTTLKTFEWTEHFGPLHLVHSNGVIYGANTGDRLITRLDTRSFRPDSNFNAGSGPAFMVAARDLLFVAEVGAFGVPGDDFIAWYDLKTEKLAGRLHVEGATGEMVPWRDGVCITLRFAQKIQCGYPDRNEWAEGETGIDPWGVVSAEGFIWVLTRGEDGEEKAGLTSYRLENDQLIRQETWDINRIPGMKLPRSLAFDELTRTILVRGLETIAAIPLH